MPRTVSGHPSGLIALLECERNGAMKDILLALLIVVAFWLALSEVANAVPPPPCTVELPTPRVC